MSTYYVDMSTYPYNDHNFLARDEVDLFNLEKILEKSHVSSSSSYIFNCANRWMDNEFAI